MNDLEVILEKHEKRIKDLESELLLHKIMLFGFALTTVTISFVFLFSGVNQYGDFLETISVSVGIAASVFASVGVVYFMYRTLTAGYRNQKDSSFKIQLKEEEEEKGV